MWTVVLALLACGGGPKGDTSTGPPTPEEKWGPPTDTVPAFYGFVPENILMISIDTFRKDSFARYAPDGAPRPMPYLDDLVRTGFTADDHVTASNWTMHGTTSTLLGAYPLDLGWVPSLPASHRQPLPDAHTTLAEALHDAGYWSVLYSGNSWLSPEWNNTQGYDHAESPEDYDYAIRLGQEAFGRLEAAQDSGAAPGPWMVHLHVMEPHAAYRPPEPYLTALADLPPIDVDLENRDEMYLSNQDWQLWDDAEQDVYTAHLWTRYRGELTYVDDLIREIVADAGKRGLLEDTLVVVWNDHGEAMFEHGVQSHAWTLHGPENDGVWLMWAENIVPGQHAGPTSAIDVAPTLLGLLDVPVPPAMTGAPLGTAANDRPRYAWAYARGPNELSVMKDGWKLVYQIDGWGRLYDRNTDPLETEDLWNADDPTSHPKVVELWPLLAPRLQRAADLTGTVITWPEGLAPE